MRYGVCTWIFGDEPLTEIAARVAALGYDGVELFVGLECPDPNAIHSLLTAHGLQVLSLTPADVDLAHPDPEIRQEAIEYYLRLVEFAAALREEDHGRVPIVSCHGLVGRIRAVSTYEEEWALFVEAVRRLVRRAEELDVPVAMEVLNRYETHLVNTASEALRFVEEVGSDRLGILLDAYHMNIEEADPRGAIWKVRHRLSLFHAADSNRQAVGRGHIDFPGLMRTLQSIGYEGPVIVECTAAGPDPFTPIKGPRWQEEVWAYVAESIELLRRYEIQLPGSSLFRCSAGSRKSDQ